MRLSRIAPLVFVVLFSSAVFAAELPTWNLTAMEGLSAQQWGPVAAEDGHKYRPALAGRQALWTVRVWWGDSFRPAEGTVYSLRITYKDTASEPVVLHSHAGVASYYGLSEVHRFGGLADGKWKTADVPVSWDLVCRKHPSDGVTEFAIESNADLPVESVVVGLAKPGAAETYFRETREWIARVQADKRKTASPGRRQEPVIPEGMKEQAVIPYARTFLSAVYPGSAPQKSEAAAPLKLRIARNEYETATFGVYANGRDLKNVTFKVGKLAGPAGELAAELDLRTAEYAVVTAGRDGGKYRLFPQRLWPAYPVDIAKGRSYWFWITMHTLGQASKPGTYTGTVSVSGDGVSGQLPVEVEVLPVMLPTMQEAGLSLGTCIGGLVPQQDLATLAENNHTGMHIWFGGAQPQMKISGEKVELDFTYLDDWMAYARKCGMTHMFWFFGGDPYGFPDTLNLERDLYRHEGATPQERGDLRREYIAKLNEKPEKVLPRVRPRYVNFVRQTAQHGKQKDWPLLIMHPFDEPAKWVQSSAWDNPFAKVKGTGPWIKDHFKDASALIREGAKGYDNVLVGGDMHHAEPSMVFMDDVDVFCTNAIHEDLKLGDKVRAAGVQFWQYSGCNDQTEAHRSRFAFGFYFGAFDSVGSLIWAYNTLERFDTSGGGGQWGYGWYTPFGTVFGPFMAGVREGFDDRRWIAAYKQQVLAKDPEAKKMLDDIFAEAIAQRTGGGRDTVYDFYAEVQRREKLDQWRNQIIDAVLASQTRPTKTE